MLGFHARTLLFANDGRQLLASNGSDRLIAIDPVERRALGDIVLSSPSVPHPSSRKGVHERLSWSVNEAIWSWDSGAGTLTGVVRLGAWGDALNGLATWSPGTASAPTPVTGAGTVCAPLALSPDRRLVAVRTISTSGAYCDGRAKEISVLDLETSKVLGVPMDVDFARVASFSRDGRFLAVGSAQTSAAFVQELSSGAVSKVEATSRIRSIAMAPSEPRVAWATAEYRIEIWQLGDAEARDLGPGSAVAFSPDGRYLATTGKELVLRDATTFDYVNSMPLPRHTGYDVTSLVFSDDSRQVAVAIGKRVWVWQLEPVTRAPAGSDDWFAALEPLPVPPPKPPPPIHHDGRLDGRVLADGKPVDDALITLTPHEQEYADAVALEPISTRTDKDGRFQLEAIPTITWNVSVAAPGYTRTGFVVQLRKDKTRHAELNLTPAVTIVGTVLGPNKRPAKGVRVFHPDTHSSNPEVTVNADARGRFVIDHLHTSNKPYVITARRPDGAVRSAKVTIDKPGKVKVKLKLAPATDDHILRLVVVDEAGVPVEGALVTVNQSQSGRTDAAGAFSIDVAGTTSPSVRVMTTFTSARQESVALPQDKPLTLQLAPHR